MRHVINNCRVIGRVCLFSIACVFASACRPKAPPLAPEKPPVVTVALPLQRQFQAHEEFTGRLEAVESVEVRPRVSGFLQSVNFTAGTEVKKDGVLFEIDPRPYQAEADRSAAMLAQAEAAFKQAEIELTRLKDLIERESASQIEFDRAVNVQAAAKAQVDAAKAALDRANLDLGWTRVTAPISGRISRNYVDVGNLVQGSIGISPVLTRIVSLDPIYVYLDIDERTLLTCQQAVREGKAKRFDDGKVALQLGVATDTGYPHEGYMDFAENRVDPNTGTLRIRGVFKNPQRILSPGLFARARILLGAPRLVTMVSERALGFDQGARFLLVVNPKNVVEYRRITVGDLDEGLRVIESGVGSTDRVIVNGLQRVRPGMTVEPQLVVMTSMTSSSNKPSAEPTSQPSSAPSSESH